MSLAEKKLMAKQKSYKKDVLNYMSRLEENEKKISQA